MATAEVDQQARPSPNPGTSRSTWIMSSRSLVRVIVTWAFFPPVVPRLPCITRCTYGREGGLRWCAGGMSGCQGRLFASRGFLYEPPWYQLSPSGKSAPWLSRMGTIGDHGSVFCTRRNYEAGQPARAAPTSPRYESLGRMALGSHNVR